MDKVYSLDESREWFLNHSSQRVICVKDGDEQKCESYPQAESFYNEVESVPQTSQEDDSTDSGLGLMSAAVASEILTSEPEPSIPDPEPQSSLDSGGGDFGGAGAGSDY